MGSVLGTVGRMPNQPLQEPKCKQAVMPGSLLDAGSGEESTGLTDDIWALGDIGARRLDRVRT